MIDTYNAAMQELARGWQQEAARRRVLTKSDPAADVLEYNADEVLERLRQLNASHSHVTPEQWAKLNGVCAETVRNYIKRGELQAIETPTGWKIPRDAKRIRKAKAA